MKRLSYQHDALDSPLVILADDPFGEDGTLTDSGSVTPEYVRAHDAMGELRLTGVGEDADGNLISSALDRPGWHMPVLDLDVPHRLVPSSTEGHSHLYLDVPMTQHTYQRLISALVNAGILGVGIQSQMRENGATFVRKPGVVKGEGARSDTTDAPPPPHYAGVPVNLAFLDDEPF